MRRIVPAASAVALVLAGLPADAGNPIDRRSSSASG